MGRRTEYQYDAVRTYNEANELVSLIEDSEDVTVFGYDANGNMVSRSGPEGTTTYTYNTWDRLVAVNTAQGKSVSYGYDVNGLRVLREDEVGERSRYLLDGVHVLGEYDETGQTQKMWTVYNPTRVDEILQATTTEHGRMFYHLDGLGSVTAISDGVQRLMQVERYLAWGGSAVSQGNIDQPFMFTGR